MTMNSKTAEALLPQSSVTVTVTLTLVGETERNRRRVSLLERVGRSGHAQARWHIVENGEVRPDGRAIPGGVGDRHADGVRAGAEKRPGRRTLPYRQGC